MKTKLIEVRKVNIFTNTISETKEEECVVLYENDTFKMYFYNDYSYVELIIETKNKIWYQWGEFYQEPTDAIDYLGGTRLAKYKQNLIHEAFELMQAVEDEKEKKWEAYHEAHKDEIEAQIFYHLSQIRPATEEELDFLFKQIYN